MPFIGNWGERLQARGEEPGATPQFIPRIDLNRATAIVHSVASADDARRFLELIQATPISAIALAFDETRASVAACVGPVHTLDATLDLGVPAAVDALGAILRLRTTFVFHDAKAALHALWKLGLDPDIHAPFDTRITAGSVHLGTYHRRTARRSSSAHERIRAEAELRDEHERLLSLDGQLAHYGLPMSGSSAERILAVYRAQHADIFEQGLATHLYNVEFPFVVPNARMEANGVHVDRDQLRKLRDGSANAAAHYASILNDAGVSQPSSGEQLFAVLRAKGHGDRVPDNASNDALEAIEHLDPIVGAFRRHRRYVSLAKCALVVGEDGRVHPEHVQLGAATGRNACRNPNVVGIGRVLRPVVTAPSGRAILELDYSQIEVGVAAAEHEDADLVRDYNTGDVYAAIAQRFYAAELTDAERTMSSREFKRARPDLRQKTKTFVLAVIYNIQAQGIADRFDISVEAAQRERDRFLALYPRLRDGLERSAAYGLARGYASIVTGLRRKVDRDFAGDPWTANFLRNTPIQGGAAVVFKLAVIALDREFRGTSTKLILPVHDAVVIECDAAFIDEVADTAARLMRDALHAVYPALIAKVDVNKSHPSCWNKDGHADSLDRFLADPEYTLEGAGVAPHEHEEHFDPCSDSECGPRAEELPPELVLRGPRYGCYCCGRTAFVKIATGPEWMCATCHAPSQLDEIVDRWTAPEPSLGSIERPSVAESRR